MSSTNFKSCSQSEEVKGPNTAGSKFPEKDQFTQSEEEFKSGHDKPKTTEKYSRM